jgi:hypothetical protein
MSASNLQRVADQVVRAGLAESLWKDVLALARPSLSYRRGRYHYTAPVSDRVRAEQSHQQDIRSAVEGLIRRHQDADAARVERREQGRVDFILPVKVVTEDNRSLTFLSRDVSSTGIRLIGTRRLLGQKVRILVPTPDGATVDFHARILWTCPVGDDLIENGGSFLGVAGSAS